MQVRGRIVDSQVAVFYVSAGVVSLLACWAVARAGDLGHVVKLAMFVIAAIVGVLALQKPRYALYGAMVAAAFDRSIDFRGLHVGLISAALVMFAPAFAQMWSPRLTPTAVKVGAAALLAGSLVASMLAIDRQAAIVGTLNWALVLNMVLGGMGIIGRDRRQLQTVAIWVSVLGAVVGLLGLLQSKGIYTIVGPSYLPDRIDSSFGYYSNFANFEALAVVVALGLFLRAVAERQWVLAWAAGVCTLVSVDSVVAAQSRGAVVSAVIGAVVLLLMRMARPAALIGTSLVLLVLGLGAYSLTPDTTRLELVRRFTVVQGGDLYRRQMQVAGGEILRSEPLGLGFDNFRHLVESGAIVAAKALVHAHDVFIQIGLDNGWLGLFGFVLLMMAACVCGLRVDLSSGVRGLQAVFAAALIGFLVQGLNDYFFFETGSLVMFSVLVLGALAPVTDGRVPLDTVRTRDRFRPAPVSGTRVMRPFESPRSGVSSAVRRPRG